MLAFVQCECEIGKDDCFCTALYVCNNCNDYINNREICLTCDMCGEKERSCCAGGYYYAKK
jgi:hypothetical protein